MMRRATGILMALLMIAALFAPLASQASGPANGQAIAGNPYPAGGGPDSGSGNPYPAGGGPDSGGNQYPAGGGPDSGGNQYPAGGGPGGNQYPAGGGPDYGNQYPAGGGPDSGGNQYPAGGGPGSGGSQYPAGTYGTPTSGYALVSGTGSLNIRSGPGTNYAAIGTVNSGQWVELMSSTSGWYQARAMDSNITGFMSANYLRLATGGGGGGGPAGTGVVNNPNPSSFLNLRQSPSYTAPVLGIFYNGATCTILGLNNGWYYVEIAGMRGYFRMEFIRTTGGGGGSSAYIYSPNGGSVNLRSAPSLTSTVIGRGAPGTGVSVILKGTRFWYINLAGTAGFMDSTFLRSGTGGGNPPIGQNPQPNPPVVIPGSTNAIVTGPNRLNLRETASTSSRSIGSYPSQTAIRITRQGLTWSRVFVPLSGKSGYMMTRYLTLYGLPANPTMTVSHPQRTYVNLRTKPSQSSGNVVSRVPHGSPVTILVPGGEWAQVRFNNTTGWMMMSFLR